MVILSAFRFPLSAFAAAAFALVLLLVGGVSAQEEPAGPSAEPAAGAEAGADPAEGADPTEAPAAPPERKGLNLLTLTLKGGWFMFPIGAVSILAVTFFIERSLALRRSKVLPSELVRELGRLGGGTGGFDPRQAYRLCQRFPSSAATVIQAMLLKVGRPHAEVEHAVAETSQREAERLYANVRWLNLSAAVAPLFGLLGTVWGLIRAFHDTTQLLPGQNKAEFLATGIYEALVTTLAGLIVAIPSAMVAHYFEGRIQALFHTIDELLFNLLPQVERYEGRVRFNRQPGEEGPPAEVAPSATNSVPGPPAGPPLPPPPPAPARRPAPANPAATGP